MKGKLLYQLFKETKSTPCYLSSSSPFFVLASACVVFLRKKPHLVSLLDNTPQYLPSALRIKLKMFDFQWPFRLQTLPCSFLPPTLASPPPTPFRV